MAHSANTIALVPATPGRDKPVTRLGQTCHPFDAVMQKARTWWTNKTALIVSQHTGYSIRTVRRWMRGEVTPDADVGYALIRTDRGPAVIVTITADMKPKQRLQFWAEMEQVSKRQKRMAQRDLIDIELEAED